MVVKPLDYFKDLIFPRFCITCGKEGEWWCERCLSKSGCNPQCSHPENYGRNENHLDGILAFFNYAEDQPIALLLKQFKYRQAFEIGDVWKKIITAQAVSIAMYSDFTLLPVPLHPRRERERGFNQAEVLARIGITRPDRADSRKFETIAPYASPGGITAGRAVEKFNRSVCLARNAGSGSSVISR